MSRSISSYIKECCNDWCIVCDIYNSEEEAYWESILTLSNGYIGIRAGLELASAGTLPGTYIAGVYDKPDKADNLDLYGVSLRNKAITPSYAIAPLMNLVEIIAGGGSIDFNNCKVLGYKRYLDMKRGMLFGEYSLEENSGKITDIKTMMLVSKNNFHNSLLKVEITPVNYSDKITVRFINKLFTDPQYIKRIKDYTSKTDLVGLESSEGISCLIAKVSETGMEIALASKTFSMEKCGKTLEKGKNSIKEVFNNETKKGQTLAFVKFNSLYTSRDCNVPSKVAFEDLKESANLTGENTFIEKNIEYWNKRWNISDIEIKGNEECQLGLRWDIFNLIQLGHEEDADVSISATGLHGQGYFGHIFWDTEIFMIPFYLATKPEIAKNLLLYRYNRLDAARTLADEKGCWGAKFPWTSTWKGYDVTPPDWERAASRAIHISGDISYAFKNYLKWTGDIEFFMNYGVEVVVETAKYYATRATKDLDGKYHILDVIGPDEYNIHADDNYYTNHLVCWNIKEALSSMEMLKINAPKTYETVCKKTAWDDNIVSKLEEVLSNLSFPQTVGSVNEQYTGFFDMPSSSKIERDQYNMPVDKAYFYNKGTQVLKQPDVIMMHYMFPDDFSFEVKKKSYEYYEQRCNHGSSLSPSIHCMAGNRLGFSENSFGYFVLSTLLDLKNLHLDKNLDEGIHMACAGGTWSSAVYGFGGVGILNDKLIIAPILPKQLEEIKFSFIFKKALFRVSMLKELLTVKIETGDSMEVIINGKEQVLELGKIYKFDS